MKSNEIIRDAMENKGYSQFDFIGYEYVSEPVITENRCIVRNVDRIDYPIDKDELVRFFEDHSPSFFILSDENNVHIFTKDDSGIVEVPYLPPKNIVRDAFDEVSKARQVQDMLNVVLRDPSILNGRNAISDFMALAAHLSRNNLFEVFCTVNDPFGYLHAIVEDMECEHPGVLSDDVSDEISIDFIKGLMKMRNLDFTPSRCLGEVYLKAESNRRGGCDDFGVTRSTYDLAISLISSGDTLCYTGSPFYPLIDSSFDGTIESVYSTNVEFLKYISGSSGEFILSEDFVGGEFNNIVLFPPWGVRVPGDELRESSVSSEVKLFEQSLGHLHDDGILVSLLPDGFLYNKQFEAVRRNLVQNGTLRAIIKIEHPLKDCSVSGYIVVVSGVGHPNQVMYVEDASVLQDGSNKHTRIDIGNCGDDLSEGVRFIDLGLSNADNGFAILLEPVTQFEGIPLADCADILRGVQVKSSDYYPDENIAGIPYLRISNIKDGALDLEGCKRISSDFATVVTRPGDLILSINGVIGKCAIVRNETIVPSAQTVILRPKSFISAETLLRAIRSEDVQKQLRMLSTGTTIRHISMSNLKGVRLVL